MIFSIRQKTSRAILLIVLLAILAPMSAAANSAPSVSNVQASQRIDSFIVDITYDVADLDGDALLVSVFFSPDGGSSWPIHCVAVSGDVGVGVMPGNGRSIQWDARQDYPGAVINTASIRVLANDELPWPYFDHFWHVVAGDTVIFASGATDTIGYGQPFELGWHAVAPSIAGLDPAMVAAADSVFPFDDGLLGYKYDLPYDNCLPDFEDCWQPRFFNEATGDSISYFGAANSIAFANDNTGTEPTRMLLPSGKNELKANAVDLNGLEVAEHLQPISFVINFDPETIILNGEQDWAHPSDPEVYPYYIELNDPAQVHRPFVAGDRIPDRTYVVFKALGRDDARDAMMDPGYEVGLSGFMKGLRNNLMGGSFSFMTNRSEVGAGPTWAAGLDGWSADTLGFLTGPSTEFTINMQAVDEHGRYDGTPAALSFDVGYPPCVQCIEVLPKSNSVSAWSSSLECVDDPALHPCFQSVPEMRVARFAGPDDLEFIQHAVMLVDKLTYAVGLDDSGVGYEADNYLIPARVYRMSVLLHGSDDPREAWPEGLRRMMAWRYQVDYENDHFNQIKDGGGNDDLNDPTWGEPGDGVGLSIDPVSGLWRLGIDVVVPENLFLGVDTYLLLLTIIQAGNDPEIAQNILYATTKQFGAGTVRAVALDQTECWAMPPRPARYHYFNGVRPPLAVLPAGQTWRDCNLFVPDIRESLSLGQGAMSSNNGVAVVKPFQLTIMLDTGEIIFQGP